jgi:hypothetical protein
MIELKENLYTSSKIPLSRAWYVCDVKFFGEP